VSSPYDDGWLLDLLSVEICLNDPRTISERESVQHLAQAHELEGRDQPQLAPELGAVGDYDLVRRELAAARARAASSEPYGDPPRL